MSKVLVTGGSGFIGSHAILQLLAAGHRVRTTVRNLNRKADVLAMLRTGGVDEADGLTADRLTFAEADLQKDAGWAEAVAGCDFVLHVASPFPPNVPKHEDELIVPAREGALRVLRASRDGGVKRVVLTSSFAAIGYGHKDRSTPFDETDWTNLDGKGLTAYVKSKTLAEHAAWNFIAREAGGLELSVVNPVLVLGPALDRDSSPSILIVQKLMDGAMPGVPRMTFGLVDVRDVVDLHLRAMTSPAANGERFLGAAGDFVSFLQIAQTLKSRLGARAKRVPAREIPDWLMRLLAIGIPEARQILPELGKTKNATNAKAKRLLGWTPRSNEECIVATAESLIRLGVLKDSPRAG